MNKRIATALLVLVGSATAISLYTLRTLDQPRRAAETLWIHARAGGAADPRGRDVILALFVSRRAPEHARRVAQLAGGADSRYSWPVVVTRRDTFASRIRGWAPGLTVVADPSLELLRGLTPLRGYPAMAAVRADGRILFGRNELFGEARLRALLAATDSLALHRAVTSVPPLPDSLALRDIRGARVMVALPGPHGFHLPQLWTYSAAGCGDCRPMLRMIDPALGHGEIDWYHLAYRGDLADGRWPLPGRPPQAILTDPEFAAADAFRVSVTPGFVLITGDGTVGGRAAGRDAHLDLAKALGAIGRLNAHPAGEHPAGPRVVGVSRGRPPPRRFRSPPRPGPRSRCPEAAAGQSSPLASKRSRENCRAGRPHPRRLGQTSIREDGRCAYRGSFQSYEEGITLTTAVRNLKRVTAGLVLSVTLIAVSPALAGVAHADYQRGGTEITATWGDFLRGVACGMSIVLTGPAVATIACITLLASAVE